MNYTTILLAALLCMLNNVDVLAVDPHVEIVVRIVEAAGGKIERTEDGQSLKLVDLAVPGAGPHDHRNDDPYDAAFFEHLGHISNLESISLAHAHFTDTGASHLAKLRKLKGLEIGTSKATPASLKHIQSLPLEYLQLGEGFDKSESLPMIAGIASLKRLTLTNCKATTDDDLRLLATMKQLEMLELGSLPIPEERLALLQAFYHLKELKIIDRKTGYPEEIQVKIKALLPKVALSF